MADWNLLVGPRSPLIICRKIKKLAARILLILTLKNVIYNNLIIDFEDDDVSMSIE